MLDTWRTWQASQRIPSTKRAHPQHQVQRIPSTKSDRRCRLQFGNALACTGLRGLVVIPGHVREVDNADDSTDSFRQKNTGNRPFTEVDNRRGLVLIVNVWTRRSRELWPVWQEWRQWPVYPL